MRTFITLLTLTTCAALMLSGCAESSTIATEKKMTVSPLSLTFEKGETEKTLSITHNCTCPFTWTPTPLDATGVLIVSAGSGDNTAVPVKVNKDLMTSDTLVTALRVTSNGYGTDTVAITIYR